MELAGRLRFQGSLMLVGFILHSLEDEKTPEGIGFRDLGFSIYRVLDSGPKPLVR